MPLNHFLQILDPTLAHKCPKKSAEVWKFRAFGIWTSKVFIVRYPTTSECGVSICECQVSFLLLNIRVHQSKVKPTLNSHTGCGVSFELPWWARFHSSVKTLLIVRPPPGTPLLPPWVVSSYNLLSGQCLCVSFATDKKEWTCDIGIPPEKREHSF